MKKVNIMIKAEIEDSNEIQRINDEIIKLFNSLPNVNWVNVNAEIYDKDEVERLGTLE